MGNAKESATYDERDWYVRKREKEKRGNRKGMKCMSNEGMNGWEKGWYMREQSRDQQGFCRQERRRQLYDKVTRARKWEDQEKETQKKRVVARWRGEGQQRRACVRGVISRMPAKYSLEKTIEVLGWKSVPIWGDLRAFA